MKRKAKYRSDMPKLLYTFFISQAESGQIPSLEKFARSIGVTLEDLVRFRKKGEFERACRESNEIRRDYLIDAALTKRHDGSFTKFILGSEYGMKERDIEKEDTSLDVMLTVLSDGKNEA